MQSSLNIFEDNDTGFIDKYMELFDPGSYLSNMRFQIGKKWVGSDANVYFIADLAANHDGDLSRAKGLIEKAKEA